MVALAEAFAVNNDVAHRSLASREEAERARHAVLLQRQSTKAELYAVCNGALHTLKEEEAAEEDDHNCGGGGEHQRAGGDAVSC